ncbi:MAG TPA: hypothetical protein VGS28_02785 [Candidatus Saccharimonadales bacterium]|nr:hypothetical protein [Candidatus Saccharimonadales bacterium]
MADVIVDPERLSPLEHAQLVTRELDYLGLLRPPHSGEFILVGKAGLWAAGLLRTTPTLDLLVTDDAMFALVGQLGKTPTGIYPSGHELELGHDEWSHRRLATGRLGAHGLFITTTLDNAGRPLEFERASGHQVDFAGLPTLDPELTARVMLSSIDNATVQIGHDALVALASRRTTPVGRVG